MWRQGSPVVEITNLNHIIMKKTFRLSVLLLCATVLFSSCIGSFRLTNNIKDWNESIGNKWVNELVFIAMHIVPVYEIAMMVDGVVLNSIEFWTGNNVVMEEGDTKVVTNSEGEEIKVTALENGYNLSDGETSMNLVFDQEEKVWSAEYNNQMTKLVKLVDDNTAQLYMNGELVTVTLDQEGINQVSMLVNNYFAMAK